MEDHMSHAQPARTPGAKRAGAGEYLFDLTKVNKIMAGRITRPRTVPASKATA
jgi:hypothetical protein